MGQKIGEKSYDGYWNISLKSSEAQKFLIKESVDEEDNKHVCKSLPTVKIGTPKAS
jgi:hypothetical protein